MTYGNKHIWLELRDTLRGISDEFVNFIVCRPQVRWLLRHLSCSWNRGSVKEIKIGKLSVPRLLYLNWLTCFIP